jgi:site-specific recombinase XerD
MIEDFKNYLHQKNLAKTSIAHYTRNTNYFLEWLLQEDNSGENFTYNDLLDFMRYCKSEELSKKATSAILIAIRHYCNYLIVEKKRNDNPAAGVFIKGISRSLPINLLSEDILNELYKQYSVQLHVDSSKKIMLGLLIYQGLLVSELMRIKSHHIKLQDGKIFIQGTARTNERILDLQALQITALQKYLQENKIAEAAIFTKQIKNNHVSELNIKNRVQYMFEQLRQLNPAVINTIQIRSSVITLWLQKNNVRQVQYMAGHKYVSSTERYQTNNLEDLQNELQQHHPMK